MYSNIATVLLVIAVSTKRVLTCPTNCSCISETNGVVVDCKNRGLAVIPTDFPNDSLSIDMDENLLTTIEDGAFRNTTILHSIFLRSNQITTIQKGAFKDLPSLIAIYFRSNQITTIQKGAFEDLPALTALLLTSNNITTIQTGVFEYLPALYHLSLDGNQITTIQNGAFKDLPILKSIVLDSNKITTIQTGAFGYLPSLETLYMGGNQITTIQQGSFKELPALNYIGLSGNILTFVRNDTFAYNANLSTLHVDLFCDCNFPFWSWIKSKSLTTDGVNCLDRNYVKLSSLQASDFDNCTYNACHYTDYCSNGGSCSQDISGDLTCSCVGDWTGDTCTETVNLCAENVDNLYTYWNTTEESTLSTLVCNGEYVGYVSRYCSSEGNWEEPNYSNCTSKSIQHIKEQIFGSLCDNLLDERNHQPWEELNNEGTGGVTSLVSAVTEFTNAFTDVLDDEISLVVAKENIVIEVGKASLDEIIVPDRLKTSDSWISDSATEITLKKNICSGLTGFSSTFYRNISNLFPKYLIQNGKIKSFNGSYGVNSIIADFTIHGTSCSDYSLFIKFDHLLGNYSKASCGHWNFSAPKTANGAWSFFGSRVVDAADSYTICEYNHTTNFAILMSPGKTPLSHRYALSLISAIGCGVSILFLVITILIHFVLWRYLKTERTKALMNLCVALILSYVIFLTGIKQTENKVVCSAIAVALHYMFLTDFALMLAEGILIVRMVVLIFPTSSIVHRLLPACWIVPFGIVGISAGVTKLKGYGNQQFCWLTLDSNLIWAFIGPALLVILINFIIIIITMYKMMSSRGLASKTLKVKSKIGLKSMCVILPLFGVTWVLGAFSLNEDLVMFQYLFAIFNSLQGLFICVFHCCLNEQVRQGYRHYQRRRHANRMDSKPPTESTNYELPKTQHINENFRSEKEEVNNRI